MEIREMGMQDEFLDTFLDENTVELFRMYLKEVVKLGVVRNSI